MINNNIGLDIPRGELMRVIQVYFEKLRDSYIVLRGANRGGAYYLNMPVELVRKYALHERKFIVKREDSNLVIREAEDGDALADFGKRVGGKYYSTYYLKIRKDLIKELGLVGRNRIHVKILIEQEKPIIIRVFLPTVE